ncbi:hypothetical protein IWW50_002215 [Coemansia erecta]|nr:hypothetical protein IWW50_002215 [Coemansia erecta]
MGLGGVLLVCLGLFRPRGGGGYHSGISGLAGVFTGCGLAGAGLVTVLSSAIFAGIRRATGLTFRRKLAWPPVNLATSTRWLQWYDTRLAQLTAKAEHRVTTLIARHAPAIHDPSVRRVWEQQLRDDTQEKLERIRQRRSYCADLVAQAQDAERNPHAHRRHMPVLALYLYVGEQLVDAVIAWMRNNPHFVLEPRGPQTGFSSSSSGGFSFSGGLIDDGDDGDYQFDFCDAIGTPVAQMPAPFIAASDRSRGAVVEPTAPSLSDSEIMKLPAASFSPQPHASTSQVPPIDPPPYTPVDEEPSTSPVPISDDDGAKASSSFARHEPYL